MAISGGADMPEDVVVIEYTGERSGNVGYRGAVTGRRYQFSRYERQRLVDKQDALDFEHHKDFRIIGVPAQAAVAPQAPAMVAAGPPPVSAPAAAPAAPPPALPFKLPEVPVTEAPPTPDAPAIAAQSPSETIPLPDGFGRPFTADKLQRLSRRQVDEVARQAGVAEPDELANKDLVIRAVIALEEMRSA